MKPIVLFCRRKYCEYTCTWDMYLTLTAYKLEYFYGRSHQWYNKIMQICFKHSQFYEELPISSMLVHGLYETFLKTNWHELYHYWLTVSICLHSNKEGTF